MSVDRLKFTKIAAVTLTLALGAVATAAPAAAHDDGWRHHRHHRDRYVEYRYAPPRYYAPPPRVVYVQPRPAYYYAPPPVVYAPPPPVVSFGFVFGR